MSHYHEELARHADSPYRRALVEVGHLPASAMLPIIHRHGLSAYEGHLAQLRAGLAALKAAARETSMREARLLSEAATLEKQVRDFADNPPCYRNHGRWVIDGTAISKAHNRLGEVRRALPALRLSGKALEEQAKNYTWLEGRLAQAIVDYLLREDETPQAAPINVQVRFPDKLAAEIVAMPARKTETVIDRNPETGAIVHSSQLERDVA